MPSSEATFKHAPPGTGMQWAMGLGVYGLVCPVVKSLEAVGLLDRVLARMGAGSQERRKKTNPMRDYVPGPQDVFVMTYPKSGTNWMMQIAHQLIHHGRGEFEHIHDVVPWPDVEAMPPFMRKYAIPLAEATHWESSPERRRVIKTHFEWDLIPYSPEARYIAVIRDPKDVFVSSYFFLRDGMLGPAMPNPASWYRMFLSRDSFFGGSWSESAAGYWAARQRPNVLVMSFKAMKRDLRSAVVQVAQFLDIDAPDALIDEVTRLSSFDYMKREDRKFHMGKLVPWRPPGSMVRSGRQGGSAELLGPAQQRAVDEYFQATLRAMGSDLPYEDFSDLAV